MALGCELSKDRSYPSWGGRKDGKMREMIKRVREDKGGFTLAELLVVVAIIGVLVAIAIPVFGAVTDNAKTSAAEAEIRVARAEASVQYLDKGEKGTVGYEVTMSQDGKVKEVKKLGTGQTETTLDAVKTAMEGTADIKVIVNVEPATVS